MAKLPINPLISEVLKATSNAKTKDQKIKILQENKTDALLSILIWNYDETAKSSIPEGEVPYNPSDAPAGTNYHTRLVVEYKKLYHFIEGASTLGRTKRESMFIQMLESLHKDDADIICLVKDGKLQDKYRITHNIVKEAFPEIIWGNRS